MHKKIKVKKRGNKAGIWVFRLLFKCGGLYLAYALLYFVSLYYLIFDRTAVSGAMAYIKRRFPKYGRLRRIISVYSLFVSQGKQLIDRAASLSNTEQFEFTFKGYEKLDEIAALNKGVVLLTAHVGNWQIALSTLKNLGRTVYLVMLPEHNEAMKNALEVSGTDDVIRVISPEDDMGGIVKIMNALKNGDIVSFMGDRPYGFDSTEVSFLGDTAQFPIGPFNVAAAADVPVMTLLVSKTNMRSYLVDVSHVLYPQYKSRKNKRSQLQVWAQDFADILSSFVKKHPYQCFLFHDIWK